MPSPELAAIVDDGPVLRSDVVEALSKYVFSRHLLDPHDRRTIVADAALRGVLGATASPQASCRRWWNPTSAVPRPRSRRR